MILTDAGPLIALIERDEPDHERCRKVLPSLSPPLVTTWPAFSQAMYLLGAASGWRGQEALWRLVLRGDLVLEDLTETQRERASALMKKYPDVPMDLADATLVAVAETRSLDRIFTLDRDFRTCRIGGRRVFDIVP